MKKICILGATGSIGKSTLEIVALHPERYQVISLSGFNQIATLVQQAQQFKVARVVVPTVQAAETFQTLWRQQGNSGIIPSIGIGAQALEEIAADPEVDVVMAAIVGAAGMPSALAAIRAGKRVLLANKEALVLAGALFMQALEQSAAELLPIDSEHNALFQCMPTLHQKSFWQADTQSVHQLWLTASGGPFRVLPLEQFATITPEQACKHPKWSMGRKISVDSATMMNKGLEVIEAHWLFAIPPERIAVLIHPQSIVHSMVEYIDGSVLAQKSNPDMRIPIAYGMAYPERIATGVAPLRLAEIKRLDFETPDFNRFPCLSLAYEALKIGQSACVVLNAANEVAVAAFLQGKIGYLSIAKVVEKSLQRFYAQQKDAHWGTIEALLELDAESRSIAEQYTTHQ